jgi:hypothetical protein
VDSIEHKWSPSWCWKIIDLRQLIFNSSAFTTLFLVVPVSPVRTIIGIASAQKGADEEESAIFLLHGETEPGTELMLPVENGKRDEGGDFQDVSRLNWAVCSLFEIPGYHW